MTKTISVLLTCHNRRVKTEACLKSLKNALEAYNIGEDKVRIEIFLTDDACTDGTSEAARAVFPDTEVLHILLGDGNLYWAGGMRFCWREAMKRHKEWDYYLLLNDDTELMPNVFSELFRAEHYAVENRGKEGIVSGITCDPNNPDKLTYGGCVWSNRFLATYKWLTPNKEPQFCHLTNANILLVPASVVDQIGIFHDAYQHGVADYDYSNMAFRAGLPVVLTADFCGRCEHDHNDYWEEARKVMAMSFKQRKAYFNHPIHSSNDHLRFVRRTSPLRFPIVWFGRMLNLYCPSVYYRISGIRN